MLLLSVNRKEISSNLRLHLSNKQWLGFQGSSNFLYYIFPGNITVVSTLFQDYFLLDKVFEKQRSQILKKIKNIFLNIEYNYSIKLKVIGVGYKIDPMPSQKILNLKLGFSHEIQFPLESGTLLMVLVIWHLIFLSTNIWVNSFSDISIWLEIFRVIICF